MSAAVSSRLGKYLSFFRIRFNAGLQYRAAALGGIATQFAWGTMNLLMFRAFYAAGADDFPMTFAQLSAYIWLRQAFLAVFNTWSADNDILESITSGSVAYELTRPCDIYSMWYMRTISRRLSGCLLRCLPILTVAFLLPAPYGLSVPPDALAFVGFLISLTLGVTLSCAFLMLIYGLTFYTMQPQGVRMIFGSIMEFLCGDIIPLPFYPEALRKVLELTPFAAVSNVPFRAYSGNIAGDELIKSIALQAVWLTAIVILGRILVNGGVKRAVIQGG